MSRHRPRHNFQTIAWFHDLYQRAKLEMNPPYQRRSVWNQSYKDYFIDTVLLGYPTAAIFLYEEYGTEGSVNYSVIDGKQRLTTLFEFLDGAFPVSDEAQQVDLRGKYWSDFNDERKKDIWSYEFLVEYLTTSEETVINSIFDRINRNVAKLTRQELRHARFDGEFISEVELLSDWMFKILPNGFPQLQNRSRDQMKDVELVANLLLLIESGPKSYSQDALDKAFSERDEIWEQKVEVTEKFKNAITKIAKILDSESELVKSRLRNQTDFYSAVGAFADKKVQKVSLKNASKRILEFLQKVSEEGPDTTDELAAKYYESARSASNDQGPRTIRIEALKEIITKR